MAQRRLVVSLSRGVLRPCAFCIRHPRLACFLLICVIFLLSAVSTFAQTSQNVYASVPAPTTTGTTTSEVVTFSKDSGGSLSIAGSPVGSALEGGPMAIDGQGLFLFVLNPTSSQISMYQINQSSGLTEVTGSPFPTNAGGAGSNSLTPVCLTTEKSGQFLYVGFNSANPTATAEIVEYSIHAAAQEIMMDDSVETPPGLIDCVTDQQNFLYVGFKGGGTNVYTIGQLLATPGSAGSGQPEVSIAVDPQGRFFFDGWGVASGFLESAPISPVDGTATDATPPFSLGANNSPSSMLVDGFGKFLYVTEGENVYGYQFDPVTGALAQIPGPPTQSIFARVTTIADPQGLYIYSLQNDGVHVFETGPDGALAEIPGSPFTTGWNGSRGLTTYGTPVQAVTGAVAQIFPPSEDFESINIGQTVGPKPISVTNIGSLPLTVTAVMITGANASDFMTPMTCSPQAFLPANSGAGSTCSVSVSFTPTAAGPRQAILTTTDAAGTQSSLLTGTGIGGLSAVTLAPGSLTFASTLQGATSTAQIVTVTSSGPATLHISSVTMGGANPGDFAMVSGCSGAYAPNATCTIGVTFSPIADGQRTASVVITDDASGSPQSVQVTGTGAGPAVAKPAVTITPQAISFAAAGLGSTSALQSITIANSGTAALHISSVQITGTNAGDFGMNNGCTATAYAAGATCTVALTFTPLATGARTATLTIKDDAPNSPQTVQLTGTGAAAPSVTLSSAAVSFGGVAVGTTSPPQNITVTNSGGAALHFSSVTLSGTNASDFSISNGCTASAYPLNTACTVGLTFTPSATGVRTATLAIADDAPNSPQTVAVSGSADNELTIAPAAGGSLSASIAAGQTATYNLQLTAGFNGTVAFTCTGAPTAATCSVPATIKVASGVSAPFLVTVTTAGSGGVQPLEDMPANRRFAPWRVRLLPSLLCLFATAMFCVIGRRRVLRRTSQLRRAARAARPRLRLVHGGASAALAALALCCVAGCGGGSVAQSAPTIESSVTPSGMSTIVITPTATTSVGAQLPAIAPIQLMLTVN
jgi:hypothetical protein